MAFFKSFTEEKQVSIKIPVNVATFGGVSRVASALSMIESMRVEAGLPELKFKLVKGRGYELKSFQVKSPAEISITVDPAWIAVFLGALSLGLTALQTLGSYKQIKEGAKEASTDLAALRSAANERAKTILKEVSGLSEQQRQELEIGIALYIQAFANVPEKFRKMVLRASHFASVVRRGESLPTVNVQPKDSGA